MRPGKQPALTGTLATSNPAFDSAIATLENVTKELDYTPDVELTFFIRNKKTNQLVQYSNVPTQTALEKYAGHKGARIQNYKASNFSITPKAVSAPKKGKVKEKQCSGKDKKPKRAKWCERVIFDPCCVCGLFAEDGPPISAGPSEIGEGDGARPAKRPKREENVPGSTQTVYSNSPRGVGADLDESAARVGGPETSQEETAGTKRKREAAGELEQGGRLPSAGDNAALEEADNTSGVNKVDDEQTSGARGGRSGGRDGAGRRRRGGGPGDGGVNPARN